MKHAKAQGIGLERIYRLFELAEREFSKHPERSRRYVQTAREISKKVRARIPDELKPRFCKKCGAYLKDGKNAAVSKAGAMLEIRCAECGFERKTGRKPQKKADKKPSTDGENL